MIKSKLKTLKLSLPGADRKPKCTTAQWEKWNVDYQNYLKISLETAHSVTWEGKDPSVWGLTTLLTPSTEAEPMTATSLLGVSFLPDKATVQWQLASFRVLCSPESLRWAARHTLDRLMSYIPGYWNKVLKVKADQKKPVCLSRKENRAIVPKEEREI